MILHGRPTSLHVLDLGTFAVGAGRVIGIPGYLITTDIGERVLVDTGFRDEYANNATATAEADGLTPFGHLVDFGPQHLVCAQLAQLGLRPADLSLVIITHSHIDHIGGIAHFSHVPIVIGAEERALPQPLYWAGNSPMEWPLAEWRTVHEDTDIGPHFTVLHVPGHAPGQLALRFDLPQTGRVILTSDAISRPSEPDEGYGDAFDPAKAQAHAARLLKMAADLVIWGHCPQQWKTALKSPDYYC
jgi:N-acyl homoserine lactone hydrolase